MQILEDLNGIIVILDLGKIVSKKIPLIVVAVLKNFL